MQSKNEMLPYGNIAIGQVEKAKQKRDEIGAKIFSENGKIRAGATKAMMAYYHKLDKRLKQEQLKYQEQLCAERKIEMLSLMQSHGFSEEDVVYYRSRNTKGRLVIDAYGYMLLEGEQSIALYPYALEYLERVQQ